MGRICPMCRRARMKHVGKIRPGGRGRLKTVYMCPRCGYRSL
jgi:transposase-like protein